MKYVIGLGNPGEKYTHTRHNIGRDILLSLVDDAAAWATDRYAQAQVAVAPVGDESVTIVLPETFMNKSGETVRWLRDKQGVSLADIIVIHDDVAIPLGEVQVCVGRGSGGNNGVQSIIDQLGSKEFVRIRVGVASTGWFGGEARRPAAAALSKFVLGKFSFLEQRQVTKVVAKTKAVLAVLLAEGPTAAMNRFN